MHKKMFNAEHDVHVLLHIQSKLGQLKTGIPVKMNEPLSKALEKLSCFSSTSLFIEDISTLSCKFLIDGEPTGSFDKSDIDMILNKSMASSFGKGEETIMDEMYHHGREIPAAQIELSKEVKGFRVAIKKHISVAMFICRQVQLKLYKLAIYTDGDHFDWHMDSTHSDNHHTTILLALNMSLTSGDLVLRHNGVEMCLGMHPKDMNDGYPVVPQMVAFYMDTEHKVELVTEGVWIVLQFDVEVVGWSKGKKCEDVKKEESG
jgi:hypothetical protein